MKKELVNAFIAEMERRKEEQKKEESRPEGSKGSEEAEKGAEGVLNSKKDQPTFLWCHRLLLTYMAVFSFIRYYRLPYRIFAFTKFCFTEHAMRSFITASVCSAPSWPVISM